MKRATRNSRAVVSLPLRQLRIADLPVQHNPDRQIKKVQKFLAELDQIPLIYASPEGEILCGEEIYLALQRNGAREADVVVVSDKTPDQLKAIRLALRRLPAEARWIDANVQVVLGDLQAKGIDLDLTEFDAPEIDDYLALDLPRTNVEESGNDIPPLEDVPISKLGEIWALDRHRIGCGDARDVGILESLLDNSRAAACFADPPYNLKVDGFISGKGRHHHRDFVQGAGELSRQDFFCFLKDFLAAAKQHCVADALLFVCIDWRHVAELLIAGKFCGLELYQLAVWIKPNGDMGRLYRNQHELCPIFKNGAGTPLANVELGKRGRNRSNVWRYAGMSSFGNQRDELLGLHPTVKPVAMIADALRDCTRRGDVVLDPFLRSGSTLIAAEDTGRRCCGLDLDPLHVDTSIRRWQNITGREAVLVATGEPFDSIRHRLLESPRGVKP